MSSAFHFESLVWDWPIAIYLFLIGVSAGMATIAVFLKRRVLADGASRDGIIKATAIIAPLTVIVGLVILIFHLTRPWTFWYLMIFYSPTSVMSMGVMLFQVYMLVLIVWLAVLFRQEIANFLEQRFKGLRWINGIISALARFERVLEPLMIFLAVALGAYTGFLLSALKTYPMLNNPVLPVLFLFSGISSGAAAAVLFGITWFKQPVDSPSVHFVHQIEKPVVLFELFLLLALFVGLFFGGGQREAAAVAAIGGGFWSNVFWFGVIGLGILLPLIMSMVCSKRVQHSKSYIIAVACMGLSGILLLRFFILYAGQMTVA
ncbi:cytochrome c nitrite reductase subunit NrfD [Budviciaceae bacterium BWR-B9]|uniref:Cytochrome c nitrite reductase subunit NrfD n=2 Tax=Limnobaculum TaxID=2172100 RepID=A0A411WQN8_9GAMM|nr:MULTISPECIES: cytochrome c nitrite reductase subunit NrfD [Limnobaculum]MBK5143843.1 cytochrome c nitrite reductase subunit NrfD [Limnobaculum allomyrinae]MBV7691501.1 cytochrome c nitrite reductase subunit NrfD [Limnobaculum sp. M2-1]QBH98507.1 cytochrome c nitrite reductase subunit NrfD [Limnobaculum zhutongyuii]TQS90046.1 cytochrome c nitrite reductase subunit NrfD [Limnobaculum zhutongyuii]